jgi:peptidoglycan/xylan/chitin deacetylase (PgdA/CDA1 family)
MAYLARLGYRVLRLDEALAALRGERPIPPRAIVLTFDDGYENFYEYAYPVLRRYRFPAIVYLVAGLVGQNANWFAGEARDMPPLMGRERLWELKRAGIDFGSHGMSHVKLAEVAPERAHAEVFDSKATLEALLDDEVRHFCYPYGSFNAAVVDSVRAAGYQSAVTCMRAVATPGIDSLRLPRKAISYGDSLLGYFWKLHKRD